MATKKKAAKKRKSKYDITVKVPEGTSFEDMIRMAVNTPPLHKKKKAKKS